MTPDDQTKSELSRIRDWMDGLSGKLDRIEREGCSHRVDDRARILTVQSSLTELERLFNEWRIEVTRQLAAIRLWVAVGALSLLVGATGWLVTTLYDHLHRP